MINRLITALICKKLHIKKYQDFRFTNQKSKDVYHFTDKRLVKNYAEESRVSINWLLSDECRVEVINGK